MITEKLNLLTLEFKKNLFFLGGFNTKLTKFSISAYLGIFRLKLIYGK